MSKIPVSTLPRPVNAILISVILKSQDPESAKEYLAELSFLAQTAGYITLGQFSQRLERPDKSHYIGKGKLQEVIEFSKENEISTLLFDDELSPSQQRNIEKLTGLRVLDRTLLILGIFAARARTASARTQVELARNQYLLPRLTGLWTHLERQRGGTGTRGGAGEKEIETDRRITRDRISFLKNELKVIDQQMSTQRKNRGQMIRVALVGYTNAGKSTLMNSLSKANVFAENKLFATLDTTVRKVVIQNLPFLISDTVGFIRKLPTQLVEAFKSTLDEVREADLLLHVIDISHTSFEDQMEVVGKTLLEIGAADKKTILIFNKMDVLRTQSINDNPENEAEQEVNLKRLKKTWMGKQGRNCVFISAKDKENFTELREKLYKEVMNLQLMRYPNIPLLY